MEKHQTIKLTFEFPLMEYVFLKMACVKQGVSMKDFVTSAVMKSIEEYEALLDGQSYQAVSQEERENSSHLNNFKEN